MKLGRVKLDTFGITLLVSLLLHALLIISLNFTPPKPDFFKDKMPALDVVLVNAKTLSKPTKADALAQANLDRGGNTEANRKMKSALPPPVKKPTEASPKPLAESRQPSRKASAAPSEVERQQKKVAELEKQARELMTKVQARNKVLTQPEQPATAVKPDQGEQESTSKQLNAKDLMASSLDIARLEAQIAKQQDEYQKRPKRRYVGARTQEYRFAAYVEAWRQKVERVGNLNYPEAAKEQKLYGQLKMTVSIRADGSIESIEINQSSGYRVLDEGARRIVELAGPYAPFPDDIRKDTDILGITRTWTFTKQDSLASD